MRFRQWQGRLFLLQKVKLNIILLSIGTFFYILAPIILFYYTRISDISLSCIDHIFIRNINILNANSFVNNTNITVQSLEIFIKKDFIYEEKNSIYEPIKKNTIKFMNYNLLNYLIFSYDWQNVLISNDIDILVHKYNHKITDLILST